MKAGKRTYSPRDYASSVFMIMTLLWLTISTPFVITVQREMSTTAAGTDKQPVDDNANPFSGLNEEKPSSANALSEYLHEPLSLLVPGIPTLEHESNNTPLIYIAYYGELLSPPPEA